MALEQVVGLRDRRLQELHELDAVLREQRAQHRPAFLGVEVAGRLLRARASGCRRPLGDGPAMAAILLRGSRGRATTIGCRRTFHRLRDSGQPPGTSARTMRHGHCRRDHRGHRCGVLARHRHDDRARAPARAQSRRRHPRAAPRARDVDAVGAAGRRMDRAAVARVARGGPPFGLPDFARAAVVRDGPRGRRGGRPRGASPRPSSAGRAWARTGAWR